jgi:hypothetical protein
MLRPVGIVGLRTPGRAAVLATVFALVAAAAALAGPARAAGSKAKKITLDRCGYTDAEYGRSAVYPFQISCSEAVNVIHASDQRRNAIYSFGPGFDGGVVKIGGEKWVCTGQMGGYNCGYPYRPYVFHADHGYTGPFTKDVEWNTCRDVPAADCGTTAPFYQPVR